MQSTSCEMPGWMNHKLKSRFLGEKKKKKIAGRNINNLRYADDTILMIESEEELKSLLIKLKKLRSWHPVPSLHGKKMGKQWKQWETLFLWTPKSLQMVTAAMKLKNACSLEEKLWLTLKIWWHIKKQRHYFVNKSPYKSYYGLIAI